MASRGNQPSIHRNRMLNYFYKTHSHCIITMGELFPRCTELHDVIIILPFARWKLKEKSLPSNPGPTAGMIVVLERVVTDQLERKEAWYNQHTMAVGFEKTSTAHGLGVNPKDGLPLLHAHLMKSREWALWLQQLGDDDQAAWLFSKCSVFQQIDNGNMLQIAGRAYAFFKSKLSKILGQDSALLNRAVLNQQGVVNNQTRSKRTQFTGNVNTVNIKCNKKSLGVITGSTVASVPLTLRKLQRQRIFYADFSKDRILQGLAYDHSLSKAILASSDEIFMYELSVMRSVFPSCRTNMQPFDNDAICSGLTKKGKLHRSDRDRFRFCQLLVRNHRKLPYNHLLTRCCPIFSAQNHASKPNHSRRLRVLSIEHLIMMHSRHHDVSSFLCNVVIRLLPTYFFGCEKNRLCVLARINTIVSLNRYETISMHDLLHGMNLIYFRFSPGSVERTTRRGQLVHCEFVAECLAFVFDMMLQLLRVNFYCTETEGMQMRVVYYRRFVWDAIDRLALSELDKTLYTRIRYRHAKECLLSRHRETSFAKLRFCPKAYTLRNLQNMSSETVKLQGVQLKPINHVLRPALRVLQSEQRRSEWNFGSSIFSSNDVYDRYCEFVDSLRSTGADSQPMIYACSVDVKSCYDNISPDEMFSMVERLIQNDEYFIHSFAVTKVLDEKLFSIIKQSSTPTSRVWKLKPGERVQSLALIESSTADSVISNVSQNRISRSHILRQLAEHICCNIVRHGRSFFLQRQGIPQGSVLSTLMCCLLLGHLDVDVILPTLTACYRNQAVGSFESGATTFENSVHEIAATADEQSSARKRRKISHEVVACRAMLVRQVDDYLLLTTSESLAELFAMRMYDGFHDLIDNNARSVMYSNLSNTNRILFDRFARGIQHSDDASQSRRNIFVNRSKSQANFPLVVIAGKKVGMDDFNTVTNGSSQSTTQYSMQQSTTSTTAFTTAPENELVWNGLRFDLLRFEVRPDFSRLKGQRISRTITARSAQTQRSFSVRDLSKNLKRWLQTRAHAIVLDTSLNKPSTVAQNIYAVCFVAGLKFIRFIGTLLLNERMQPYFIVHIFLQTAEWLFDLANKRVRKDKFSLTALQVRYIAVHAFSASCARDSSKFFAVIRLLRLIRTRFIKSRMTYHDVKHIYMHAKKAATASASNKYHLVIKDVSRRCAKRLSYKESQQLKDTAAWVREASKDDTLRRIK